MSPPGEELQLRAVVHLAATAVARGDFVPATVSVLAAAGSSSRRVTWGEPVTGGIRRRGEAEPRGWFFGRVAGAGRWATLDPDHPLAISALVGTWPTVPGRPLPPGGYDVVVRLLLNVGSEEVRMDVVGPQIHLV
jgi:hypothetical protein